MAQNPPPQILPSPKGVQDFPGEHVLHHGIDGEIPAHCRLFDPQMGVGEHLKIPVSPPGGLLPAGHGNVQIIVLQTINAEAGPHFQPGAQAVQNGFQLRCGNAMHLNVHVLAFHAPQPVPDIAAHIVRPSPHLSRSLCHPASHRLVFILHG